jgi:pseudouridine-5'-phosphate glycosidase/pseudouridine kinase
VTALERGSSKHAPVAYCTPNLLELNQLFETAQSDAFELTNHPSWWSAIENLNLGSAFRMDLEQLARKPLSEHDASKGDLSFLIEDGIAQKAIHLLPFFQHLIIKCGDQGILVAMLISPEDASQSDWANMRSNPRERYIVAPGNSKELIVLQHIPSLPVDSLVNVTGAGDSFVGALLAMVAHHPGVLYRPETLHEAILISQKAAVLTLQSHSAVSPLLSSIA